MEREDACMEDGEEESVSKTGQRLGVEGCKSDRV